MNHEQTQYSISCSNKTLSAQPRIERRPRAHSPTARHVTSHEPLRRAPSGNTGLQVPVLRAQNPWPSTLQFRVSGPWCRVSSRASPYMNKPLREFLASEAIGTLRTLIRLINVHFTVPATGGKQTKPTKPTTPPLRPRTDTMPLCVRVFVFVFVFVCMFVCCVSVSPPICLTTLLANSTRHRSGVAAARGGPRSPGLRFRVQGSGLGMYLISTDGTRERADR
jgi:hypothetical protein